MTMHILLIESNKLSQTESLAPKLEAYGYQVDLAHTPTTATKKTETLWPSLIVFNPTHSDELASFQAAIQKTDLNIPCLIVSDANRLSTAVKADTIVVAPDKPQQLTQGIKKAVSKQKDRFVRLPNLILDCHKYQVLRTGKRYALTPKQFKLLHLLIGHHDQVLSRKVIMQKVWETDYLGDTRTLDVHIRWLREKIEDNPSQPHHLITVRGVGYRFITGETE